MRALDGGAGAGVDTGADSRANGAIATLGADETRAGGAGEMPARSARATPAEDRRARLKLLFDFDGTLHKTDEIYVPAFREGLAWLREQGQEVPDAPADPREIGYWLGYSTVEMWANFAPELPAEWREKAAQVVGAQMRRRAREGGAKLYPGIPEALDLFCAQGYVPVFLSNCHHDYMELFRELLGLDRWFCAYYCAEDYGWKPKSRVFSEEAAPALADSARPLREQFIMIGDRFHDLGVAVDNGLLSIGCAYGFGKPEELEPATLVVHDARELPDAVGELAARLQG